jgi:hypothetical protein
MLGICIDPKTYLNAPLLVHIDEQTDAFIKHDAESLAAAVMYYGSQGKDINVVNVFDEPVLSSLGFYLDRFYENVSFTKQDFLEFLLPMQEELNIPESEDSFVWKEED